MLSSRSTDGDVDVVGWVKVGDIGRAGRLPPLLVGVDLLLLNTSPNSPCGVDGVRGVGTELHSGVA